MFFCRFASGRSASTDLYSSNEKCVQKMTKKTLFFDFSNHARAQVPIVTPKMKKMGTAGELLGASGNATRSVVHNPRNTRARGQDDGSSKQTPSN